MPASDFAADRLITRLWPVGTAALTYYVRPAGSDSNTGLSPAAAFLTFERALRQVSLYATNRPLIIDVTGCTFNVNELLQIGGTQLGGIINTAGAVTPPTLATSKQVQVVATPTVTLAIAITSISFDLTTGLATILTPTAIAPGQLTDKIMVGGGAGEYGAIVDYTTGAGPNTIEVASTSTFSAPMRAYEPGATFTYGDAGQAGDGAIHLAALADWYFEWIGFASHGKQCAMTVWPHAPVLFFGCTFAGVQLIGGSSKPQFVACSITGPAAIFDGADFEISRSLLADIEGLDCNGSSSSGGSTITESVIDACAAWGGGNGTSRFSCQMANCSVRNGNSNGVEVLFGTWTITSCDISDSTAAGVYVSNADVTLQDVTGTNNGTYGCNTIADCSVEANGAAVTGATADVKVGRSGDFPWSEMPATCVEELARVRQLVL